MSFFLAPLGVALVLTFATTAAADADATATIATEAPSAASALVEPTADLAATLAAARAAEAAFEVARALELYRAADVLQPDDPVILQKIAQQLSDLSLDAATPEQKKAQAEQALAFARRAVALAPDQAINVLSLAICYGKLAVFSDTRTKIAYSRRVREEAERALALDPDYDWAHHTLGRWHYEVATLGLATRVVVRVVYGGLPDASVATAITSLERAVALAPQRVPHHLELGFAYLAARREAEARASFARGLALPSVELYDEPAKARAREALRQLDE
jgi:tetratricopeptide (TPR) repeat protein